MAAKPQQPGDDHLRTAARPRLATASPTTLRQADKSVPSTDSPVNAVADAPCRRATGELPLGRGGVGVMVVGDDQHQRQFFHRGLVQGLVKRAGGGRAVADAGAPTVPEMPLNRWASSAPFTTEIIAPRWLIMANNLPGAGPGGRCRHARASAPAPIPGRSAPRPGLVRQRPAVPPRRE